MIGDRERLLDMLEAIERIESRMPAGRKEFGRDEMLQVWVVHHVQIIGEAARKLSDKLHQSHPEIPWPQIIAMRNVLVHDYFGVDVDEVWDTVQKDIPDLKHKLSAILATL